MHQAVETKHSLIYLLFTQNLIIVWKHNREDTLFRIITITNDRLSSNTKNTISRFACLNYLPFIFYQSSPKEIVLLFLL